MDTDLIRAIRDVVLTGLAIILPVALTIYLIWFSINLLGQALRPFVETLEWLGIVEFFRHRQLLLFLIDANLYSDIIGVLSEIIALLLFATLVVVIGALARYRYGEFLIDTFDYLIASVPGIGTIYQSLRQVGKIVLNETSDEFEAVVLVELLSEETYLIAFKTSTSPEKIEEAAGHSNMETVFVPMAPNPVTGGFLTYVPQERVIEVDMTVNDAVQAILTSGIGHEQEDVTPPVVDKP